MSRIIYHQILNENTGGAISAFAMASGTIVRTEPIDTQKTTGFAALQLIVAGTVTVTQQVSYDQTNWYNPIDTTAASLSSIIVSCSTTSQWISFNPVPAPYTRMIFTANSTSTISARFIQQGEI